MSKKDELLNKAVATEDAKSFDLTEIEIIEVASLMALEEQAQAARNFMYSRIVERIGTRLNIADGTEIDLNWAEIMSQGVKVAKLVVKD